MAPFLACCCCCPGSCPSKCCQKPEQEQYTRCELFWPAIALIIACLVCIGACIAGFTQSSQAATAITNVACSLSIVTDDLLNGNVTDDNSSFFVGLNSISTQLYYLKNNISQIDTAMSNVATNNSNMTNAVTAANNAMNAIQAIPLNGGSGEMALTYSTPLNSASPSTTISSNFPSILGSTTTSGLVYAAYTIVSSTKAALVAIGAAATNFKNQIGTFNASVASVQNSVLTFANQISSVDATIGSQLTTANTVNTQLTLGIQLFYGITAGFSVLVVIGTLLVVCCDKYSCRYLMYFSCGVLFVIGVVGFIISIVLSITTPTVYFGCQFLTNSLSSSTNFTNNFQSLVGNATVLSYVTTCLPTSSGNIINVIGGNVTATLQNLSSALLNVSSFNGTYISSQINAGMTNLTNTIGYYKYAQISDITDQTSLTLLQNLANSSAYPSCTATGFSSDSWVPSDSQKTAYVNCQISGGNNATSTQCTTTNLNARTGGCTGCMDTASIFASYTSAATVQSNLNTRYPSCTTFTGDLSNVWNNFYYKKITALTPVGTRASTATTSVSTFTANMSNIVNVFNSLQSSLASTAASVTDPTYGFVAGLNCRLFGSDVVRFQTVFCTSVFNFMFFTRIVIGVASFGLLFMMCCTICTGVRHFKHSIRKDALPLPKF